MLAGVESKEVVFLLDDSQLVSEQMTEDINAVLNSADVPNLYTPEDFEKVCEMIESKQSSYTHRNHPVRSVVCVPLEGLSRCHPATNTDPYRMQGRVCEAWNSGNQDEPVPALPAESEDSYSLSPHHESSG